MMSAEMVLSLEVIDMSVEHVTMTFVCLATRKNAMAVLCISQYRRGSLGCVMAAQLLLSLEMGSMSVEHLIMTFACLATQKEAMSRPH